MFLFGCQEQRQPEDSFTDGAAGDVGAWSDNDAGVHDATGGTRDSGTDLLRACSSRATGCDSGPPVGECVGAGACNVGALQTRTCSGFDLQARRCGTDCQWTRWSDCDRDLDGIADDEDSAPDDPYGQRQWTPAGYTAHREQRVPEALTATWDGRVIISPTLVIDQQGGRHFEYAARAFQPHSIGKGRIGNANFSAVVNFDPPDRSFGNLHLALFPDRLHLPANAMGQNPYPSDAAGRPTRTGSFATYKVGIIGVMSSEGEDAPHAQRLSLNYGTIVVANASDERPTIHAASVDGQSQPLTTRGGASLYRYEPTVSLDGRLVIWHGVPQNRFGGSATMYSFNPTPMRSTGWSDPRNVAAMYWVHGAGAASETMVDGVAFSERYPLARRPLVDPAGRVLHEDNLISGTYPWLSFDASELFVSTVATYSGRIRSGNIAVGVRTNWIIEHFDSTLNAARATLSSDGKIHFDVRPEGRLLFASYRQHTLGDGSPLGHRGFERVLVSALFLSESMWDPFLGDQYPALPVAAGPDTYGLITSTYRYAEVVLDKVSDGHYLLALPMNEQLHFNHDLLRRLHTGDAPREVFWNIQREMVQHEARQTPDVSGHRQTGRLGAGAAFPYEYHDALGRWRSYLQARQANPDLPHTPEGVGGDTIDGIVGNAIYFPAGSSVRSTLSAANLHRLRNSGSTTVQLWVKPLRSAGGYTLYHQQGLATLALNAARRPTLSLASATMPVLLGTDALPTDRWSHLAFVLEGDQARLFVDGDELSSANVRLPSAAARQAQVIIGPHSSRAANGTSALCLIDEFALSDVARHRDEIRRAALRRPAPRQPTRPVSVPVAYAGQEQWLPDGLVSTPARVELGRQLFFDPRLSRDRTISCASCHMPSRAFADGRALSLGIGGSQTARNSQTLLNRLFGRRHFWDGRARSLEQQVLQPIEDPGEMDLSVAEALKRVAANEQISAHFAAAYDGPTPTQLQLAHALASFVRSLHIEANSPFDRHQLGPAERRGKGLFFGKARCSGCHNGPNFSDERFHNVGLVTAHAANRGRVEVTRRNADLGRFKTPTLRQLVHTAPYFHDGRFATLQEVVAFYNRGGDQGEGRDLAIQPLGLSEAEQADLVAFLQSLSF